MEVLGMKIVSALLHHRGSAPAGSAFAGRGAWNGGFRKNTGVSLVQFKPNMLS